MVEPMKIVAASVAAVIVTAVAAIEGVPAPEGFWPVTVVGWISAILGVISIIGTLYAVHRFSQKPLLAAITKLEDAMDKAEKHFDQQILTERNYFTEQLADLRKDAEHENNAMSIALEQRMNAFGGRIQNTEEQYISQGTILSGMVTAMAESRLDRAYINVRLEKIQTQMEVDRHDKQQFERELFKQLAGLKNRS